MQTGLTDSPQTDTASPAAKTLRAALISRSWWVPHSGHTHSRMRNGSFDTVCPQTEHRLLDGYQRSMPINVRPYHCALYVNCLTNSDQPASPIDFAKWRFFCILLTDSVSMAITWFSLTSLVESLCRESLRTSVMRACRRATLSLAFLRLAEPFCFFASLRCRLARLASYFRNVFGEAIFSPVDRMAKWVSPRSIPTCPSTFGFCATTSSHSSDTKYRPAASFDTVTVVTLAARGMVRDQRIASGASIFASLSALPSHRNALVVYSAAWGPSLRLKAGYFARLVKKLANAVCRWRSACCTGTLLTSFSHTNSGSFFIAVSLAEVS